MSEQLPNGKGRGKWMRILVDEFGDSPRWSAIIRCPECDARMSIVNHMIAPDGRVTPSVGHPVGTCSWHPPSPLLLDWAPCPPPPPPLPLEKCVRCLRPTRALGGWTIANGGLHCPSCFAVVSAPELTKGATR